MVHGKVMDGHHYHPVRRGGFFIDILVLGFIYPLERKSFSAYSSLCKL